MLVELERECLEVYRRKVEEAANAKARLNQSVAAKEAELATLMAALGELNIHSPTWTEKRAPSLKVKLASVNPLSDRLHKVFDYVNEVHSLCGVLGLDFGKTVSDVHPSLHGANQEQSTNISNSTLEGLEQAIIKLKLERKARIQKLKDIVASLFELWNLMDSPKEEKNTFSRITSILGSSESEVIESGVLSTEMIEQASAEVERLTKLKASRMKELVMKRRSELEEICKMTHIEPDTSTATEKSIALIDSGLVDPSELLASIEAQIVKAKEEAMNRKEVMDRTDRWLLACEEEKWLEEYNQEQKKLQDLLLTEKEAMYGSKPSPRKANSFRKPNGYSSNGNGSMTPTPRRNSVGGATPELLTLRSYSGRQNGYYKEMRRLSTAPLNFVAITKEDTMSFASVCDSEPGSPPQC
ncbi:hypothetical protein GH714_007628 [Hevea brasiliensis]|uniref:Uncharacterized protein n=1 Tax=Hevea brasiliensis TaxID=3981 RepID=A0A6A6LW78_HEVBR|nr:hypothetical protein GH714_007628 [Hevea brasiliensis]